MRKTRASLIYPVFYLFIGGIGFALVPRTILRLFLSNGTYSDVMVRLVGVFMISLGIVIVQIIRYRVEQLYTTTLIIRSIILATLLLLYFMYSDPLMLVLFGIVCIGFFFTFISYILDKNRVNSTRTTLDY